MCCQCCEHAQRHLKVAISATYIYLVAKLANNTSGIKKRPTFSNRNGEWLRRHALTVTSPRLPSGENEIKLYKINSSEYISRPTSNSNPREN